jgi:hypothetical protein
MNEIATSRIKPNSLCAQIFFQHHNLIPFFNDKQNSLNKLEHLDVFAEISRVD